MHCALDRCSDGSGGFFLFFFQAWHTYFFIHYPHFSTYFSPVLSVPWEWWKVIMQVGWKISTSPSSRLAPCARPYRCCNGLSFLSLLSLFFPHALLSVLIRLSPFLSSRWSLAFFVQSFPLIYPHSLCVSPASPQIPAQWWRLTAQYRTQWSVASWHCWCSPSSASSSSPSGAPSARKVTHTYRHTHALKVSEVSSSSRGTRPGNRDIQCF